MKKVMLVFVFYFAVFFSASAYSQEEIPEELGEEVAEEVEEKVEESKELKFGATPFVFTDPNTGFGGGAAGIIRDVGKEARDITGTVIYTSNQYETYSIDWTEPHLFAEDGWGKIYLSVDAAPVKRFYGFGNDSSEDDVCNWRSHSFTLEPRYTYWFKPAIWGLRAQIHLEDYKVLDSDIDVDEDDDTTRPISEIWPDVYNREDFQEGAILIGPGLFFIHDNRSDLAPVGGGREERVFPTRGGRQELTLELFDETFGSEMSYSRVAFDARHYFPLTDDELTVVALRGRFISLGGDIPFWKYTGFGSGDSIRGFHSNRFYDRNSLLFNAEIRQAVDAGTSLFKGRITLRYPMLVLFYDYGRVYEDPGDVFDKLYGFHDSYGAAFRFIVTPSIVIRFEYAFSEEETDFYVNAGHAF
jgi:hypothetical protein